MLNAMHEQNCQPDRLAEKVCVSKQANRLARMDAFRLLAAFAVIWIHVPRSVDLRWTTIFCRFAVPFFAAGVAYFAVTSGLKATGSVRNYLAARCTKLYMPFLFWTVVYLSMKLLKGLAAGDLENSLPGFEVLWTGGAYHFWFIPFAIVISAVGYLIGRCLSKSANLEQVLVSCILIVLAGFIANVVWPISSGIAEPWVYMLDAAPAAIAGMVAAILAQIRMQSWVIKRDLATISLMWIAGILSLALLVVDGRNVILETIVGVSFFALALHAHSTRFEAHLAPFGRLATGIYFVHLLFIKVLESLGNSFRWNPTWSLDISVFLLAAIASVISVWLLGKSRWTNWTVT
jgi:surface polysaccharide O-acyltransferase-like enzyme